MTLGEYITALVERLAEHEPAGALRLREVVGRRIARIGLDDETVDVQFARGALVVEPVNGAKRRVEGYGRTDRATAAALLDARLEVHEAILDGALELRGDLDAIRRIGVAIEILIDAATRVPALRELSGEFRGALAGGSAAAPSRDGPGAEELALLVRLGLFGPGGAMMETFSRFS